MGDNRMGILFRRAGKLMTKLGEVMSGAVKSTWEWLKKNKGFSGIVGTILMIIVTIMISSRSKNRMTTNAPTINTGPITVQGGGNAEIIGGNKIGFDGKDVAAIVEKIMAQQTREKAGLFQEIGNLKEQLTSALQRAAEAEVRGNIPEAKGVIEELRKTGDTKRLLDVLVKERDLQKSSLIERNREIAAVAYLRDDIEVTRTAVEEILKLCPNDVDALNRKGVIELLHGDLNEAEKIFSQVLGMGLSDNNDFWQSAGNGNLGLVYLKRGELDKAEEMFSKVLDIEKQLGRPDNIASAYGNLGVIYQTRGDLDKAEEMYKKSLNISEKTTWLLPIAASQCSNLGGIYEQRGDLGKAREYWEKALGLYKKIGMPNEVKKVEGWIEKIKEK